MLILIFLLCGIVLAVLAYRFPALGFALIFCLFGIEQLAGSLSNFFLAHSALINVAIGVLVLAGIAGKIIRRDHVFCCYLASAWMAIALYSLAFASLVWTPDPQVAWHNWMAALPYVVTLIVLLPLLVRDTEDLGQGLLVLTLIGAVVVLLLFVFGEHRGRGLVMADAQSQGNPLAVAQLGAYVVFAVLLQHFAGVARIFVLARWAIVITALLVMGLSGSRGQLLFLFAVLLVMIPARQSVKRPLAFISAGFAMILLAAIAGWLFQEYLQGDRRWSGEGLTHDAGGRLDMAIGLLRSWLDTPLAWPFGLGTSAAFEIVGFYPHVVPLEVLGEEGVLGFILFIVFTYRSAQAFVRLLSRFADNKLARGQITAVGAIAAFEFLLIWKQGSLLGSTFFFGTCIVLQRLELVLLRAEKQRAKESQVRNQ